MKILVSSVVIIPFIGPLMYLFAMDGAKTNPGFNNTMPRGGYTHIWISLRDLLRDETNSKIEDDPKESAHKLGSDENIR